MGNSEKNRVGLFVCHDLIGILILNRVLPMLVQAGWNPLIINTTNKRNRKVKVPCPAAPAFYGAEIVDRALIPFLDSTMPIIGPNGSPRKDVNYSYKQLATLYKCAYHEIDNVDDICNGSLFSSDADIVGGISIRFLQVFNQQTIDLIESHGFFWNLHGGILPDYKGLLIPYRAIENGEQDYGWTLHRMAKDIDAGDIVSLRTRPLSPKQPVFELYRDMIAAGSEMLVSALSEFRLTEKYQRTPQRAQEKSSYYPYPTAAEMERYDRMGIRFINSPIDHIERIVSDFSVPQSHHAHALRNRLIESVRQWAEQTTPEEKTQTIQAA